MFCMNVPESIKNACCLRAGDGAAIGEDNFDVGIFSVYAVFPAKAV